MTNFYSERTVKWEDDTVVLIDQTKLPNKFIHIRCNNYNEVAQAIRTLAVRGAPAIGATAAFGLALAAKHSKAKNKAELLTDLEEASDVIRNTRPTAMNLLWALQRIMNLVKKTKGKVKKLVEVAKEEAIKIAEEDVQVNHVLGKIGAKLLDHGDIVLTHCK
jgi:methylthioribose-1-phosphate isomerase